MCDLPKSLQSCTLTDWDHGKSEWNTFLDRVSETRSQLNCSFSNAWFRGHANTDWQLKPSLLRIQSPKKDPEVQSKLTAKKGERKGILEAIKDLSEKKSALEKIYNTYRQEYLKDCSEQSQAAMDRAAAAVSSLKSRISEKKSQILRLNKSRSVLSSLGHGERDAFHDWTFRSGVNYPSSWECLADMQHHRVPTRLLDWTESLAIAIYFALEHYRVVMDDLWKDYISKSPSSVTNLPPVIPCGLPTPAIWILNPYKLAEKALRDKSILNFSIEPETSYFECFFLNNNWKYHLPAPIFSPWKSHRIAAQGGIFTTWGTCRRSLDRQLDYKDNIMDKIDISPAASVYGVRFLRDFAGMSEFTVFRDLDSLGARVRDKFIDPKLRFR